MEITEFCVYVLHHPTTNKSYVGSTTRFQKRFQCHISSLNNGSHHNVLFQQAWNIDKNLRISKVFLSSVEEIRNFEDILIKKLIKTNSLFNIIDGSIGGDALTHHPDRDEIRTRVAIGSKKYFDSLSQEEKKMKYGRSGDKNGMFGKKHTAEVREILSKTNLGREMFHLRGVPLTDETKRKLSEKAKLKVGALNPFFGKKHTDAYKKAASERKTGTINLGCSKALSIDGQVFTSATQAAKQLCIPMVTIWYRTNSKNPKFSNYFYIS